MQRNIWVFSHNNKTRQGIPNAEYMKLWITDEIYSVNHGRYHHTHARNTNGPWPCTVVLVQDRIAYGYFELSSKDVFTKEDEKQCDFAHYTYIVANSVLFATPFKIPKEVELYETISDATFQSFLKSANGVQSFPRPAHLQAISV